MSERTDNMRIEPEISGVSVVLLGDFNPAIFTPAWFALHGLLPEECRRQRGITYCLISR